ncbi:hypothetical protein BC940DRAFT_290544 [Gongronella butleri]|nr:hypothetical protein BC940DRAFT_290544 [Gongronella butleri]
MTPPRHSNGGNGDESDGYPQSELDMLESMLNHMFAGTVSMLFKTINDPGLVEISSPLPSDAQRSTASIQDLDGSDFVRISQKRQRQRQQKDENDTMDAIHEEHDPSLASMQPPSPPPQQQKQHPLTPRHVDAMEGQAPDSPHNIISIFNQDRPLDLFHSGTNLLSTLFGALQHDPSMTSTTDHQGNQWSFSAMSTSQRSTVLPDGTEETVTTTQRNGQTETVTRVRYADGTVQETRQVSTSSGRAPSMLPSPSQDSPIGGSATGKAPFADQPHPGILSRFLDAFWPKAK